MVEYIVDCDDNFKKIISKLDQSMKIKVKKQIKKKWWKIKNSR